MNEKNVVKYEDGLLAIYIATTINTFLWVLFLTYWVECVIIKVIYTYQKETMEDNFFYDNGWGVAIISWTYIAGVLTIFM